LPLASALNHHKTSCSKNIRAQNTLYNKRKKKKRKRKEHKMKTNIKAQVSPKFTHEGGRAELHTSSLEDLKRTVSTCMLWEDTFYEEGNEIAERVVKLCEIVKAEDLAALAIGTRTDLKLRHIPLFLCLQLVKIHKGNSLVSSMVSSTIAQVIQRPDELTEIIAMYYKQNGRKMLPSQLKKGIAKAFLKFNEYSFAKYDGGKSSVKLRDALFLSHAKPTPDKVELFKAITEKTLAIPDTWEVELSAGKNKKETWERLLREKKLGYMALLRNLRNMIDVGVGESLIEETLRKSATGSRALPFRFIQAAIAAPSLAQMISDAMLLALDTNEDKRLRGKTAILIDISGSMDEKISEKSTLSRWQAAAALGILCRELCDSVRMFTFSYNLAEIPNIRGIGLLSLVDKSQRHGGTWLGQAINTVKRLNDNFDRLIVITDEQSADELPDMVSVPKKYIINVAPYKNGVDTKSGWTRVNGWSERILDWIVMEEREEERREGKEK
jgi:hypothetical protein